MGNTVKILTEHCIKPVAGSEAASLEETADVKVVAVSLLC